MVFRRKAALFGVIGIVFGVIGFVLGVTFRPDIRTRAQRFERARALDRQARRWQAEMDQ